MNKENIPSAFKLFPILSADEISERQTTSSCGSAEIKTNFKRSRICSQTSQIHIHNVVYDDVWDGAKPCLVHKSYSEYYDDVVCYENYSLFNAKEVLDNGYFIQILWTDNLPELDTDSQQDGHWSGLIGVNLEEGWVELDDPSNSYRVYDRKGFVRTKLKDGKKYHWETRSKYKMKISDFLERWHDIVDEQGKEAKQLALVVNPYSVKATYIG